MARDHTNTGPVSEVNTPTTGCAAEPCAAPTAVNPCVYSNCTCGCTPCQCAQNTLTANPMPFYDQVPACQEEHTEVLIQQTFTTAVSTAKSFNMPACNASISVVLTGVQNLQVGSYLWNSVYGYLYVSSFDFATSVASLTNKCQPNNAAPGTQIPSCTLFNIVDPPYEAGTNCGEGVWVTEDFITPEGGFNVTVQVTNTLGLTHDAQVQVGSGVYVITSIDTPNSITIANVQPLLPPLPFSTIHAYDANGNCITPITPYADDACGALPDEFGSIVICDNAGSITTLDATEIGVPPYSAVVPVCTDADTNTFQAQLIYTEVPDCADLTACLTLTAGTNSYTVIVDNSAGFNDDDVVSIQFGGPPTDISHVMWLVTDVPDATHIKIILIPVPNTYNFTVPEGTKICHASCCDQLRYEVEIPLCDKPGYSAAFKGETDFKEDVCDAIGTEVTEGGSAYVSARKSIDFVNDTCSTMRILMGIDYFIQGYFNVNQDAWIRTEFKTFYGHDIVNLPAAPAAPALILKKTLVDECVFGRGGGLPCDNYNSHKTYQWHETRVVAIPVQSTIRIDANMEFKILKYEQGDDSCCACGSLVPPFGNGKFTIECSQIQMMAMGYTVLET